MSGFGFFARLSVVVQRRARWVVGLWLLLAVGLTVVAPSLADVGVQDDADFLPKDSPSQQAEQLLRRLFPNDPDRDAAIIVVTRSGGLELGDQEWLRSWVDQTAGRNGVAGVQSATTDPALAQLLRSSDGAAELTVVDLEFAPFTTRGHDLVTDLRESLDSAPSGVEHHLTGLAGLAADQSDAIQESFDRTAIVTLLLVLAILIAVYRSAVVVGIFADRGRPGAPGAKFNGMVVLPSPH